MDSATSDRNATDLRNLLPDLDESESGALWAEGPDEFSLALNLVYYAREVRAIGQGSLFVIQELEAMNSYRDDLDEQIRRLPDTALRTYIVTQLDLVDAELVSATVQETPRWRPSLAADRWWWHRTPRRTDQRLYLEDRWERTVILPERVNRRYDAWEQSGDDRPFAEWWRAQRASSDQ